MEVPLRISSRHLELPAPTEALIRKRAAGLSRFHPHLLGCDVTVEGPGGHHRNGGPYDVRLRLAVPGEDVIVQRRGDEELLASLHDAFDAAVRRLQDQLARRRHWVKRHEDRPHGWVLQLFAEEGYGFLVTAEGKEVYFHRNAVQPPGFEGLAIGSEVQFTEEQGDEGPQALAVSLAG